MVYLGEGYVSLRSMRTVLLYSSDVNYTLLIDDIAEFHYALPDFLPAESSTIFIKGKHENT